MTARPTIAVVFQPEAGVDASATPGCYINTRWPACPASLVGA
jgi:hypothetical protein